MCLLYGEEFYTAWTHIENPIVRSSGSSPSPTRASPGKSARDEVLIDDREFAHYRRGHHAWLIGGGEYRLYAASSRDVRCTATIALVSR